MVGGIVHRKLLEINFGETQTLLEEAQQELRRVVQYIEPTAMVQKLGEHLSQIISLQKHISDLQTQQFLPPECDHSTLGTTVEGIEAGARRSQGDPENGRNAQGP